MALRSFDKHIISLLHFDYPYYAEPNDGLLDEILGTAWRRSGGVKLAGGEIPADEIISGTPKFGYRCLSCSGTSDYIYCASSVFSINDGTNYEYIFWVRPVATSAGNIFAFMNASSVVMSAGLDSDMKLVLNIPAWSLSLASSAGLPLNTWTQCAVRVTESEAVVIVSTQENRQAVTRTPLSVNECRIGGLMGQIDEVIMRSTISETLPSEPVKGRLNVSEIGGFGTGALGSVNINADCVMNTYAYIEDSSSGANVITISNKSAGKFGDFSTGGEIMLLDSDGNYEFARITSYDTAGSRLYLNAKTSTGYYGGQAVLVPNFNTLTIASGATVSPLNWNGKTGGIVVFRVKGDCTVNGSIITSGKGRPRTDSEQLTHGRLIDKFIQNTGGAIYIVCGGTFSASSSARLGASWDGSLGAGTSAAYKSGTSGGAGYGGGGAGETNARGVGGSGGVGGGGGCGEEGRKGYAAGGHPDGYTPTTGGYGHGWQTSQDLAPGGTQGVSEAVAKGNASGGGGAGQAGAPSNARASYSGANLVLVTETLNVDAAAVSTGGEGGMVHMWGSGGGGTGFCYIAAKSMV